TESGSWLTEKLFGVIIYIVLGFIALDYRQARSQQARFIAFPLDDNWQNAFRRGILLADAKITPPERRAIVTRLEALSAQIPAQV
ncbi:SirB2 family protein, partial [Salmonella enterica subsp. enterica serovar Montevideo]|nr:SirB2 family protein [Salmonella enterica subsp. enterica serovar Montevideo]